LNHIKLFREVTGGSVLSPVLFSVIMDEIMGITGQDNRVPESVVFYVDVALV
jgi:hypothetical protein